MKISLTIMAHPKRAEHANWLFAKLHRQGFSEVHIVWDEKNSEWHTGKRALLSGVGRGDWHVVLQDDAILPNSLYSVDGRPVQITFYEHVVAAIQHAPVKTLISLYTGTVKPFPGRVKSAVRRADAKGYCWLRGYLLFWGVGIAIPTDHIKPMLDFVAGQTEPYDTRIGYFYQRNMLPVLYTNPSLVDHNEAIGSLLDHVNEEPRVAVNLVSGPVLWNSDALDI